MSGTCGAHSGARGASRRTPVSEGWRNEPPGLARAVPSCGIRPRDRLRRKAAAPLPVLGRWRSLRSGSACHRTLWCRTAGSRTASGPVRQPERLRSLLRRAGRHIEVLRSVSRDRLPLVPNGGAASAHSQALSRAALRFPGACSGSWRPACWRLCGRGTGWHGMDRHQCAGQITVTAVTASRSPAGNRTAGSG